MKIRLYSLAFAAMALCSACNQTAPNGAAEDEDGLAAFSADSMRLHVSQLSHDPTVRRVKRSVPTVRRVKRSVSTDSGTV